MPRSPASVADDSLACELVTSPRRSPGTPRRNHPKTRLTHPDAIPKAQPNLQQLGGRSGCEYRPRCAGATGMGGIWRAVQLA